MFKSRYQHILRFFGRLILSFIWWDLILPRVGLRRLSSRTRPQRMLTAARLFRAEAVRLGGVMIKVGQFMSARLDVLPQEITDELSGLQDEVRAESFEDVRRVVESEFGATLAEKFTEFETSPVASASIGQVHRARLLCPDGVQPGQAMPALAVVVKVQRPHIEEIVATDLAALKIVGGWLYRYRPIRKRANVPRLLEEFSRALYEEIDYLHEGQNAERFAANFKGRADIRVPVVHWSHTTHRVLTLENVQSIKIADYAAIEAAGIDRAEVATRLFDTYFKQIFEDHFFHADPHPGNLFIHPLKKPDEIPTGKTPWQLVFVDFGMTGQLTPNVTLGLREALIGMAMKDAARVVKAFQTLDVLLPGADLYELEKATTMMLDSFWGKTIPEMMQLKREEATKFIRQFRGLVFEMPFQAPENMILLGRCMSILAGICTGLDPAFNMWTSVAPYAQKLVQAEGGATFKVVLQEALSILQVLIALPKKTESLLNRIESGKLEVRDPELSTRLRRMEKSQNQTARAVLFAAFLLGAVQLYLAGDLGLAISLGAAGLLTLVWFVL